MNDTGLGVVIGGLLAIATVEDVTVQFDPVGSWTLVGVVAAVLATVLFLVGPDRTRVSQGRVTMLVLMRLGAFVTLVACMLRPTFVATSKAQREATLLILADASQSMSVADGPNGRTRWEELTAAVAAIRTDLRELEAEQGVGVEAWRFNRDARPVAAVGGDPLSLGEWSQEPAAEETAIGAALDDALRSLAGRTLAGVIVLSDGGQHAYPPRDLPPQTAARKLGDAGVPLWSITLGQHRGGEQGRDASIVNLSVAETVYLKNALEVAARVRLDGLADREAVVKLLAEDDARRMEEVSRTTVRGTAESTELPVRLAWAPSGLGERKLAVVVEPQEGEVVTSNNELSTFVEVVDGGLRVLYLEGALRVEQRFLRRVLAASPDMQVEFQWIDSTKAGRNAWPVDLSRDLQGDFNVIMIGDLDAAAIRMADIETIARRVQEGAGLGLLGGFHAFEAGGWGNTPLRPALPFEPDRLARQPFDEPVRESLHIKGPLRMVPEKRFGNVSILRLADSDAESRAAWDRLPPLAGANDLGQLVPSAKPLATTADGRPLLVGREYGAGRVLAFAADSTWQWAMQGAIDQHRRFWRQFVLWLARQDDADEDSLWLRLAQRRLSPGSTLEFDAGLTKPDGSPVTDAVLTAEVIPPNGAVRPIRIGRRGDTFGGTVADFAEPGDWRMVVRATRPDGRIAERSARFTIFRQDVELANPRANPLLMRQLAEATPGGVRTPEEIGDILEEIRSRPATFETLEQWSYTPWDKWPLFLLLAAFLCGEWFLRKRFGLV
jgi:hypothetical protein